MPISHTGSNLAIQEFIKGETSRTPAWFAEEMMLLINSTYLSHRRQDSVITPEDLRTYSKEFFPAGFQPVIGSRYLYVADHSTIDLVKGNRFIPLDPLVGVNIPL